MIAGPVILDSDTLSELSRGHPVVRARAEEYLRREARLTITAVSLFERLRGYRTALLAGKPMEEHLKKFEGFVATCRVLPVDRAVAGEAAIIWAALSAHRRRALGDILIAATASAYGMPLVTRNQRDFSVMAQVAGVHLSLFDWTK